MRAVWCRAFGVPPKVEEVEPPALQPGTVRIRIALAAANPPDVLMPLGRYQVRPTPPFAVGLEGAGVVAEVARDVTGVRAGERVMTYAGQGCMAEEVVVPAKLVHPIPDAMSFETAAGFWLVHGTAYHALVDRGRLAAGESVAVLGAAGGIGLCAVQIAKALDAQVIAVASTSEKRAICLDNGADAAVPPDLERLRDQLRDFGSGVGVHVVHDTVGGPLTLPALRGLRPYGRHLIVGYSSGEIPLVPGNYLLLKQVSVTGVSFRQCAQQTPTVASAGLEALLRMWAAGQLRPTVSAIHPLERFDDALHALSSRAAVGKHLVRVADV